MLDVQNPFIGTTEARRYHERRPSYHDLPFQQLRSFLGRNISKALDVACGTGHSTVALARISTEVVGCDVSSDTYEHRVSMHLSEFIEFLMTQSHFLSLDVEDRKRSKRFFMSFIRLISLGVNKSFYLAAG